MKLSNEQQIISYIIKNIHPSRSKRTLIFKLIFLADLEFYNLYNQQITSYKYCFHNYGPFCPAIYSDLEYLELLGMVTSQKFKEIDYIECRYDYKGNAEFNFSKEIKRFLDFVIELGNKLSLKKILDIVYDLPLLKITQRYEDLDLTKMKTISEKKEKTDTSKYKDIIARLNLEEKENISTETSGMIEQEYLSSSKSIDSVNREFING